MQLVGAASRVGAALVLLGSGGTPRVRGPCMIAADWPDGFGWPGDEAAGAAPTAAQSGWRRVAGCDVLLPEQQEGCVAIVHFVGGALVGAAPQQTYGGFLDTLSGYGIAVIATPSTMLTGLDHWAAADEVAAAWRGAITPVLRLLRDEHAAQSPIPVIGIGHSLGAKLLLLLGCRGDGEVGPRLANVLVSYNNYAAERSIPLLKEAAGVGAALGAGGAGAAQQIGGWLEDLGEAGAESVPGLSEQLRDSLGSALGDLGEKISETIGEDVRGDLGAISDGASAAISGVGGGITSASEMLARFGSAARGADGGVDSAGAEFYDAEFSPSPAETDAAVRSRYTVGRNFLVRFADDEIDQSAPLGALLRSRFTDEVTGIGGRVELRTLAGTHVTPNTPQLRGLDWSAFSAIDAAAADEARSLADRLAFEQEVAAGAVAGFVLDELEKWAEREAERAGR